MFQTKFVEKIKRDFIFIFFPENLTVYEIMWKNMVEADRTQMTLCIKRRMRFACWITTTTNTRWTVVVAATLIS